MRRRYRHFLLLAVATLLAADIVFGTGLVRGWGSWYSDSVAFRHQTNAFLKGELSLGADPSLVWGDLIWANGGVHHPWGLGVPAWRLPFELVAKVIGRPGFPDRLAFGAAILLVGYCALGAFRWSQAVADPRRFVKDSPAYVLAPLLLLLFPPFLTLCGTRFAVYEEAVAYGYLFSIALLIGTIAFARRSSLPRFIGLNFAAGFAPFIRPTLLFYGLASLGVSVLYARSVGWKLRSLLVGPIAFGVGIALLCWSNYVRFGSAFEFGHQLNLNGISAMRYASRFGHPFTWEPLGSACTELFTGLFFVGNTFNGSDWYNPAFFSGQSPTHRWREFYFKTFDITILCGVVFSWIYWCRWMNNNRRATDEDTRLLGCAPAMWSLLSAVPMFLFYMRCPFLSSRYLIDFAPAMGVAMSASLVGIQHWFRAIRCPRLAVILYATASIWWCYQLLVSGIIADDRYKAPRTLTRDAMAQQVKSGTAPRCLLPTYYTPRMQRPLCGLSFNGEGWNPDEGQTTAAVSLFVQDPRFLEVDVAPGDNSEPFPDYTAIQAKVGLEFLKLRRITKTPSGWRIIFGSPQNPRYRSGLQVAFLGFTTPQELSNDASEFRLLRVRWR